MVADTDVSGRDSTGVSGRCGHSISYGGMCEAHGGDEGGWPRAGGYPPGMDGGSRRSMRRKWGVPRRHFTPCRKAEKLSRLGIATFPCELERFLQKGAKRTLEPILPHAPRAVQSAASWPMRWSGRVSGPGARAGRSGVIAIYKALRRLSFRHRHKGGSIRKSCDSGPCFCLSNLRAYGGISKLHFRRALRVDYPEDNQ